MDPIRENELLMTRRQLFGRARLGIGTAALASMLRSEGFATRVQDPEKPKLPRTQIFLNWCDKRKNCAEALAKIRSNHSIGGRNCSFCGFCYRILAQLACRLSYFLCVISNDFFFVVMEGVTGITESAIFRILLSDSFGYFMCKHS